MPYLRVRIASSNKEITDSTIGKELTNLAVTKLGKAAKAAAVDIYHSAPAQWFIGGESLQSLDQTSFFVEIKITESTNTRDQKAAFVKAVFNQMSAWFQNISKTSYVVVQDVASDSWGFGGKTQEYRYMFPDDTE
ncbi:tautomerase family protein [Oenococcus sicerae]|uniref:tautomerase family protein n=1 Tax=Oenococcus sicerae TaxID=2203724 RepID=UPI0010BA78EB|nr:hypothetical protein OAL24_00865 [Oenococcus sicerae]